MYSNYPMMNALRMHTYFKLFRAVRCAYAWIHFVYAPKYLRIWYIWNIETDIAFIFGYVIMSAKFNLKRVNKISSKVIILMQ